MVEKELFIDKAMKAMSTIIESCYDEVCYARDDFDKNAKTHLYNVAAIIPVINKVLEASSRDWFNLKNKKDVEDLNELLKTTLISSNKFIIDIMKNYIECDELMGSSEFSKKFSKCKDIITNLDTVGYECNKIISGLNVSKTYNKLIDMKKNDIIQKTENKLKNKR